MNSRVESTPRPRVSVVMPSLNQGRYVEQAIQSVIRQAYPQVELIVMDGGSSDETLTVLKRYAPSLAHWVSTPDAGPAEALNEGFAHASGDIFAVLNADDYYLPGALRPVAEAFAADPAIDVVSGHGFFAKPTGEIGIPAYSDRWDTTRFSYGACVLLQPATFFRRVAFERAGGFRSSGRVCWDMELWADLAATGARFGSLDAFIAAFRLHHTSITGRDDMRRLRRAHARAVMAEVRGRPESALDRARHWAFRVAKFSSHPLQTVRQRAFVHATLRRWSL